MPLKAEGEFALVRDRIHAAFERPGQPVKRGTMAHDHDLLMSLTDTAAQLRDEAAVREHAPRLEELAVRDNHRLFLPIAHRAWGVAHRLAGEYDDAERRLNRASALFAELGTRWQHARTLVEFAELEMARSAPARARDYFAGALAVFNALGAVPDATRVRDGLAAIEESL